MMPKITNQQIVMVELGEQYQVGDVVLYYCLHSDAYFLHRLLGSFQRGLKRYYLCKGDNRKNPDALFQQDQLLGKVVSERSVGIDRIVVTCSFYYWSLRYLIRNVSRVKG